VPKKSCNINDKLRRELHKKPNVVGVGLGYRQKEGHTTDEEAIVVFVTRKVPRDHLMGEEIVPNKIGESRIDVIEIGEVRFLTEEEEKEEGEPLSFKARERRTARHRPAPGGVSIGHYRISAGTLGAVVRDKLSGRWAILSNNHVLANSSAGNDGRASPGDVILQPGSHDGGRVPRDVIGYLERFVPLNRTFQRSECSIARFGEEAANRVLAAVMPRYRVTFQRQYEAGNLVDAALARPLRQKDLSPEILSLGRVAGCAEAVLGDPVVFSGRTSGLVRGRVVAREVSLFVTMDTGDQVYFVDQLVTSALSRPGDSGALLLDGKNRAVGLLFAGSNQVSICNRIAHVCRLLEIDFNLS